MTFSETYLGEACIVLASIDHHDIDALATHLWSIRKAGGRLYLVGLGGSAAHASHAAADFRKLCEMDAICLTDNVAAFSAAANDDGWACSLAMLLKYYNLSHVDGVLILSVGGGSESVSLPLAAVYSAAHRTGAKRLAILGRDGGKAKAHMDAMVLIPPTYEHHVTPHTEGLTSVVLHCLVSHPLLQNRRPKWESLA